MRSGSDTTTRGSRCAGEAENVSKTAVNDDGETFAEWTAAIDALISDLCGMSHSDFADAPYYDNWADGVTPDEMLSVIADYDEIFAMIQTGGGL